MKAGKNANEVIAEGEGGSGQVNEDKREHPLSLYRNWRIENRIQSKRREVNRVETVTSTIRQLLFLLSSGSIENGMHVAAREDNEKMDNA